MMWCSARGVVMGAGGNITINWPKAGQTATASRRARVGCSGQTGFSWKWGIDILSRVCACPRAQSTLTMGIIMQIVS